MSSLDSWQLRSAPPTTGKKIDYFVVAPPDSAEKAWNFKDTKDGDFLHPLMSGLSSLW